MHCQEHLFVEDAALVVPKQVEGAHCAPLQIKEHYVEFEDSSIIRTLWNAGGGVPYKNKHSTFVMVSSAHPLIPEIHMLFLHSAGRTLCIPTNKGPFRCNFINQRICCATGIDKNSNNKLKKSLTNPLRCVIISYRAYVCSIRIFNENSEI